jgi:hypothetical protein
VALLSLSFLCFFAFVLTCFYLPKLFHFSHMFLAISRFSNRLGYPTFLRMNHRLHRPLYKSPSAPSPIQILVHDSRHSCWSALSLKMGRICFSETSVTEHQLSPRDMPENYSTVVA